MLTPLSAKSGRIVYVTTDGMIFCRLMLLYSGRAWIAQLYAEAQAELEQEAVAKEQST